MRQIKYPLSSDVAAKKLKSIPEHEEVVISGISGHYPQCSSIEEFAKKLYNNEDLVTEDEQRWRKDLFATPMGMGKLDNLDKFDSQFFGFNDSEPNSMDAQMRVLLERAYEAIWDSGTVPSALSGSNTGVFIGNCFDETLNAYSSIGQIPENRQFIATQISHRFNFRGPSMAIDTACASSFSALNEALTYMRHGIMDSALVCGINLGLNPIMQYQFFKLNMLSPDGRCKCLDESANGYAKGEAVVAILLQRKPAAKRIYATLVHTKTNNDGYEEMGITFPTWDSQRDLMRATYAEAGVNPHDVDYVEAHCTGTQAGDPEEMRAICESMCSDGRKKPIMIGAHKSNIGHTEASSGLCAVSKVLISFENELIPGNIHYNRPNPKVYGIQKGLLQPVSTNMKFTGAYAGLNNFGFGGSNIHVIVKCPKIKPRKDNDKIVDKIPRLVTMCGRDPKAVNYFFEKLLEVPEKLTRDLLALVNDISKTEPFNTDTACRGMTGRGFALIEGRDSVDTIKSFNAKQVTEKDREVWFILSGMGTQWQAMAKDLVRIDCFEKSIKSLCQTMKKYSIDLWSLLMDENQNIYDSVLNSFLTIAAIQIALIDLLEELGVRPDGIVGHSIGELTSAYADKVLTAEETIVMAYWRGKCIESDKSCAGRMAAIGMGAKEAKTVVPSNVFIACDNSDDSVTVSGDERAVDEFVKYLKDKNLFAAGVNSCGVAFHSPLMYPIGEQLTARLKSVMSDQRKMSTKWVSANFNNTSKTLTSNYFVDNLLYPIRFNEAIKQIPTNAVVVEIAPHCLLQSIIKRSLGPNISYVPMMRKDDNNLNLVLEAIGQLYACGLNPAIEKLYPKVEYPVSNGTKFISPLVKWIHEKKFVVTTYPEFFSTAQASRTRENKMNLLDTEDQYITGHVIDSRNLYPGTGYLLLVWKHMASFNNTEYDDLPIEFRDVIFHRATIVVPNKEIDFQTTIDPTSGNFVLMEGNAVVVTGNVKVLKRGLEYQYYLEENSYRISQSDNLVLKKQDIYTALRLRGYDYGPTFQCISEAYVEERKVKALVEWPKNWVSFADNMIQIGIVGVDTKGLFIPVRLDMIRFDPKVLSAELSSMGDNPRLEALFDYDTRIGVTKGLEYRGLKTNIINRNINVSKVLTGEYKFEPYEGPLTEEAPELVPYGAVCDKLADSLHKKFEALRSGAKSAHIVSPKADKLDNKALKGKDRYLYHFLSDIQTLNQYSVDAIKETKYFEDLPDDPLLSSVYNKWLVDTQVITVYDNKKPGEMKVLEMCDSHDPIQPSVAHSLDPHEYYVKLVYNVSARYPVDTKATEWPMNSSTLPTDFKDNDLVIYKNDTNAAINLPELFQSASDALKPNAFFQVVFRDRFTSSEKLIRYLLDMKAETMDGNRIRAEGERCGLTYIGWNRNQFGANAMLFRKVTADINVDKQVIIEMDNNYHNWLSKLQEAMATIHTKPEGENIWIVANNTSKNGILGLVYSLRREVNGVRVRCIFNYDGITDDYLQNRHNLTQVMKKDLVYNVYKDNHWGCYKPNMKPMVTTVQSEHCFLNNSNKGDLSSLKWFECQHKLWPNGRRDDQQLCKIYYSALNFRDIMLATGRLPPDALPGDMALHDCILGLEFSGRDENGNRVMGMIPSKALATTCVVDDPDFLWPIPDNWSMEEASTVPCVYSTAYYSLIIRGNLKRGEKVLIHSGSGGVGQAAINICLSMDCQVFITVGSAAKRQYLKKLFPKLTDKQFSSSRDLSFKTHVMNETRGKGVDLVLNSLSDDKLKASIECLADNGRFLEIGKYDMSVNSRLDMSEMIKNKSFHGILLDALFTTDENTPQSVLRDRKRIWELIEEGIKTGTVKPLDRSIFCVDECEEAFRYMSSGKHMGKVVIKIRDEEPNGQPMSKKPLLMEAVARTVFDCNKVYIISGGLGGFGLELIDWMCERGAKKFLVTSRVGFRDSYQKSKVKKLQTKSGADIHIVTDLDLTLPKEATQLLNIGSRLGPIGGVFHLALVLADSVIDNQTVETFRTVCQSKSDQFLTLDIVCRKYCPDIDYFVAFSSGVTSRGNVGQTNYGFSNAIMDRICDVRRADGYSALAIQWGVIGDVGVVVRNTGRDDVVVIGTVAQRMPSCLQIMDTLLQSGKACCLSYVKCEPKQEASGGKENFMKKLAHILGMDDIKKVDPNTKLLKLGMDSLMAVEVQLSIEREFGSVLTAQEVRELSIARVLEIGSKAEA